MIRWKACDGCVLPLCLLFIVYCAASLDVEYKGVTKVEEGKPFTIQCFLSLYALPKWTVNGVLIDPTESQDYALSQEQTRDLRLLMELSVSKARTEHSGDYRCNAFSRKSHRIDVVSRFRSDIPKDDLQKPTKPSSVVVLKPNQTVELACDQAENEVVPVNWFKNGVGLVERPDSNLKMQGNRLIIERGQQNDAGQYMCRFEHSQLTHPRELGRIIDVHFPATIEPMSNTLSLVQGTNLTLECRVRGFPVPWVTWLIGNSPVEDVQEDDPRISLEPNQDGLPNSILTIQDVTFEDRNLYTCQAENSVNLSEESTFIVIRENMIRTNGQEPGQGVILVKYKPLVLHCNVSDVPDLENAVMDWYKNGVKLNGSNSRVHIYQENNTLIIDKPTLSDTGDYTCALPKDQLRKELSATISVRAAVEIEPFPKSINLVQGDTLTLYCEAVGYPAPEITWYKDGVPISNETDSRVKLMPGSKGEENAKLVIGGLNFEDRAKYMCEASNIISRDNSTTLVRIKDKLAALWPFLGICAEVAILCAIIFIYEKKRVKPDFDESDTDQNPENKNVPDQKEKGQDVRQRK